MDAQNICRVNGDWHSRQARVGAICDRSASLVRAHMKLRRPGVRIEDELGNPVSFFQLKDAVELEAEKFSKSKGDGRL
jgi:hypothetical protein